MVGKSVPFNVSLRGELLNEELFGSLDDARRKLALWRYGCNNVRQHSSLGNKTSKELRCSHVGFAHSGLVQTGAMPVFSICAAGYRAT
jgi:transposase InsO family protein